MPPPSPLTRRPQATALSIEELLDRVRRGELRVPEFQRPLQWKAKDVSDLLDSVYRGYPIGTLLFWKRAAPAASVRFGPVTIDAPHSTQALWVVDGQQRLISLAGVLLHPPYGEEERDDFILYFDLQEETFVRPGGRARPATHWLPMNVVIDSELLLAWLDRYPGRAESPSHTRTAMRLGKALREYQVPAYIVEADEEQTLRVIFGRLNSAGKPLKQAEVFNALHGGAKGTQPADLRELSQSLEPLGFGTLEQEWLLKAALAVKGLDMTRRVERLLKEEQDLGDALQETARSMRDVIVFIKRDVGIPHVELLPYKLPLALLTRFFHLHPQPSPRSRELLARWVWRGAITEAHRGESIAVVRESLAAIGPEEERSVRELLATVPQASARRIALREYNFRTAQTKLQVNALLALKPRDLRSGEIIDGPALIGNVGAGALLRIVTSMPRGVRLPPRYAVAFRGILQGIANRLIHPVTEERSLLATLRSASLSPEVLQSHSIAGLHIDHLHAGDTYGFLRGREYFLYRHIRRFLDSKARWGESD
ncbi:DUF262 domain-containing protein, partial [Hyalangium sp.]|uniref:DUF262 domain-containing protein n=1 Tax=Hyalangium sp. TaxID=2028555 RepID=UPI002D76DF5E